MTSRPDFRRRIFAVFFASYAYPVAPQAPNPPAEAVEVKILSGPPRDRSWWFTTAVPVLVSAAALAVALLSLVDQQGANKVAVTVATRQYAVQVSFLSPQDGSTQYEIENRASAPITSVLVQPAAHTTVYNFKTVDACTGISFSLPSSNAPVVYFLDANGAGWQLRADGTPQPSADPSTIQALLPRTFFSSAAPATQQHQPLTGCS